jgi:acyl-CoA thioesterase FadM
MGLKPDIEGMVWEYPDSFVVGREQVRQYAQSVQDMHPASYHAEAAGELGYGEVVAPLTFISIFGLIIQKHFFTHVDVGMETMQIVQVDQKFVYHQPIQVGDVLHGTMHIESVNERFGAYIVGTRNVCSNDRGEVVLEAFTTLMGHEGDNSIAVRWDPETGQVVRKAAGQ